MKKSLILILGLLLTLALVSISWADGAEGPYTTLQDGWFGITFLGSTDNQDGTSTWSYYVEELGSGKGFKDLSHWVLGLGDCAVVLGSDPAPYEVSLDPRTGVYGIKWETGDSFESGMFSFTLDGMWAADIVQVATKAGRYSDTAWMWGPSCTEPEQEVDGSEPPDGGEEPPACDPVFDEDCAPPPAAEEPPACDPALDESCAPPPAEEEPPACDPALDESCLPPSEEG